MNLILSILIILSIFLFINSILNLIFSRRNRVQQRVKFIKNELSQKHEIVESKPSLAKELKKEFSKLTKKLANFAPSSIVKNYEKLVIMAGKPLGFNAADWSVIQISLAVVLPVITIFLTLDSDKLSYRGLFVLLFMEVMFGIGIPRFYLASRATKRLGQIQENLVNAIDIMTICIEAGSSFDSAALKIVEKMDGPIADEFDLLLKEIKLGKPRAEALRSLYERVPIEDMQSFTNSIIQADKMGLRIGNILKIQSIEMRENKKHRIKQKIARASIKMLIPMVIFIIPTILIITLGPAIINLIRLVSGSDVF